MATENKGIGDIVKNCKILLLDIEGTTTSISFVKDKLFPYVEANVKQFLESEWETADVRAAVTALRKLALEDKEGSVDGVVSIPDEDASKEDQIEGLVGNVKWQMKADRKAGPLKALQGLIWKQGYDKGDIKGHVYDDVSAALEQWQSVDGQKIYIYSSGSVQAQKLLFGQTSAGDLLHLIDGHFDTAVGAKQEAASYKNIAEKIGCKPEEILFLTDILKEAEAARAAGLHAALVSREGNAPLPAGLDYPVLHSFADLTANNKRKPEPQEDETPAKILKTDVEEEAKTKSLESESTPETKAEEKMEVEDAVTDGKVELTVEEITDSIDAGPIIDDIQPVVVEEKEKKTEETVEAEVKTVEPTAEKETKADATPVAEETLPVIITEIEDITEKQLDEVEEMIVDDLKPVVEEPEAPEIDELQNVGEVLEKECDEILSKVSNVTNLDNITIKPMLNTITEETENGDTNDIVDRILDSELEMEMKQCVSDIDASTVSEMGDELKTEEVKTDAVPQTVTETSPEVTDVPQAKTEMTENEPEKKHETNATENSTETTKPETPKDNVVEENTVTEEVKEESKEIKNATETVTEEVKETKATEEPKVNGKAMNGDTETTNGDDVNSRLSATNGKVNGANGDSMDSEQGQGDCKGAADIKVKTVATEEPCTDPVEQPTTA